MSAPRCCGACDFYRWAEQEGPGECRHRSPKAVEDRRSGAWRSQWPPLWPHEWCGAFRPKEQPAEDDDRLVIEVARVTLYEGPEEPTHD